MYYREIFVVQFATAEESFFANNMLLMKVKKANLFFALACRLHNCVCGNGVFVVILSEKY